jgi:neutral trehalase
VCLLSYRDAPNCWPPLLLLLVEGLERCAATTVPPIEAEGGSSSTMKAGDGPALAREIAQTWVRSAHAAFVNTGFMYEKYHSDEIGVGGSGGEYAPQVQYCASAFFLLLYFR